MNNEQVAALVQKLLAANPNISATDLQNAVMGAGATFNQFRTVVPTYFGSAGLNFDVTPNKVADPVSQYVNASGTPISKFVPGGGASDTPIQDNTYFVRTGNTGTTGAGTPTPTAAPTEPAIKRNANGGIIVDTSGLDPQYSTDANGNTNILGYYGLTTINGKKVAATTDENGNLIRAAQINSETNPQYYTQYDSKGNAVGTTSYLDQSKSMGLGNALGTIAKGLGGIALTAAFPGLTTAIGSALGAGAGSAAIVGGAALGGLTSAVTGGNPLTGAALGGLGGYLQGASGPMGADYTVPNGAQQLDSSFDKYLSTSGSPFVASGGVDYSLTGSSSPNLQDMGGGQGITQGSSANLQDMGGGQGITMPTSANLSSMGGGQGITTNAAGGGTLGQGGVNTGASLLGTNQLTGQQLGTALKDVQTGVSLPGGGTAGGASGGSTSGSGNAAGGAAGAAGGVLGTSLTAAQLAALGSGLGSVLGSSISNNAIGNAQNLQNAAAATSQSTLKDIYNQQLGFTKPYQDVGVQGANALSSNLPYFQHQFDVNDLTTNLAPNYQFQLGQGQMANQRAANVGGGALSGNTLTGLNRYTQDYAGNAYQQAFNNYDTQRKSIYNTLSGIAGIGNTANQQAITAGTNYGTNTTNLTTGLAAAQAGANVAQSTNQANTLNNIINNAALLLGQNNTSPSQGFKVGP
jgi:hypothetical protein